MITQTEIDEAAEGKFPQPCAREIIDSVMEDADSPVTIQRSKRDGFTQGAQWAIQLIMERASESAKADDRAAQAALVGFEDSICSEWLKTLSETEYNNVKEIWEIATIAAEKRHQELEKKLSVAIEALDKIKPAFEIVHDHYLSFEEQASVIGVTMEQGAAERVRLFWEAHEAFESALAQIAEKRRDGNEL